MHSYYSSVNYVGLMLLCHTTEHIHSLAHSTNVQFNVNKSSVSSLQIAFGFIWHNGFLYKLRVALLVNPMSAQNTCIQISSKIWQEYHFFYKSIVFMWHYLIHICRLLIQRQREGNLCDLGKD